MDLQAAEMQQARGWNAAKIGAFICFLIASGLLVAALLGGSAPSRFGSITGEAHLIRAI